MNASHEQRLSWALAGVTIHKALRRNATARSGYFPRANSLMRYARKLPRNPANAFTRHTQSDLLALGKRQTTSG
ncbi:hypothetical protein LMG29542_07580 [Paraburkholderia humisilvae]|uniref:Uncharacterized protein n=1 Tax=Paraburkholderia humisilvae TaxID=627669 RepID=A0A6J5F5J7_9BURK|nr:hypothetical protein LMG29542_07580 [Paraburkholderia humisilvae]